MNVRVVFTGRQTADGETVHTTFTAAGTWEEVPGGRKLCYTEEKESAAVSMTVCGERVLLIRRGEITTHLILEQQKPHVCRCATPFGVWEMNARTVFLQTAFTAAGGALRARYTLETGGGDMEHEIEILVEEVPIC